MTSQPIRTGIAATALAGMVALLGCGSGEEKTAADEGEPLARAAGNAPRRRRPPRPPRSRRACAGAGAAP